MITADVLVAAEGTETEVSAGDGGGLDTAEVADADDFVTAEVATPEIEGVTLSV